MMMCCVNCAEGCPGGEVENPLVVSFGEMLIDFVPDLTVGGSPGFIEAPGGAPANVAVAITKLGGRSAFIGKVSLSHTHTQIALSS